MPKPFWHEQPVLIGDETFRLTINFRALDLTESTTDKPFDDILANLEKKKQVLSLNAKFLHALLLEHHPDISLDQATGMLLGECGETIGLALHTLLRAAFPEAGKSKGQNPRNQHGASATS